jgi:hypothetical protein
MLHKMPCILSLLFVLHTPPGGNILFATVPSGISSMALLTFAFLDYATFVVSQ